MDTFNSRWQLNQPTLPLERRWQMKHLLLHNNRSRGAGGVWNVDLQSC